MKFRPLADRVVIKKVEKKDGVDHSIIVVDTRSSNTIKGTVVAVGPGADESILAKFGMESPPTVVNVGDTVLVPERHAFEVTIEGQQHFIVDVGDILGVF